MVFYRRVQSVCHNVSSSFWPRCYGRKTVVSIKMINQTINKAPKRRMVLAESYRGAPRVKAIPSISVYDSSGPMQKKTACKASLTEQSDIQTSIKQALLKL